MRTLGILQGRNLSSNCPLEGPEQKQELEVREVEPHGARPATARQDRVAAIMVVQVLVRWLCIHVAEVGVMILLEVADPI